MDDDLFGEANDPKEGDESSADEESKKDQYFIISI